VVDVAEVSAFGCKNFWFRGGGGGRYVYGDDGAEVGEVGSVERCFVDVFW
jgi:hypothetical protein